jgi:hypothetical protein
LPGGDELLGMATALLHLGTRTVGIVAPLPDEPARVLMRSSTRTWPRRADRHGTATVDPIGPHTRKSLR